MIFGELMFAPRQDRKSSCDVSDIRIMRPFSANEKLALVLYCEIKKGEPRKKLLRSATNKCSGARATSPL
jgi:hypothetical protein